jgi:aspartate kinase
MELQARGYSAFSFTGSQAGIITDNQHTDAKIINVTPYRIEECIQSNSLPIIAGFQGVSLTKEITTLGRGGSDTTAVAMGAALGASVVEFYKDVPGVYSNDPKVDKNAILHKDLSYDNALKIIESAEKKLLHPRALHLARLNQLPLFIQSFEKENLPQNRLGSWIREMFRNSISQPVYEVEKESCSSYSQSQIYFTSPSNMMSL